MANENKENISSRIGELETEVGRKGMDIRYIAGGVIVSAVGLFLFFYLLNYSKSNNTKQIVKTSMIDDFHISRSDSVGKMDFGDEVKAPVPIIKEIRVDNSGEISELQKAIEEMRKESKALSNKNEELLKRLDDEVAARNKALEDQKQRLDAEFQRKLFELKSNKDRLAQEEKLRREHLAKILELDRKQTYSKMKVYDNGRTISNSSNGTGDHNSGDPNAYNDPNNPHTASTNSNGNGYRQNNNEKFYNTESQKSYEVATAAPITTPSRTIVQGTTIPGVLETAINSSLPGTIRAVVSRDVYSFDGSSILIPKGTRLIGTYNSNVQLFQERISVVWTRAVMPNNQTVDLGSYGGDRLGVSGQTGFVDTHFASRFGSAALISVIGAAPEIVAAKLSKNGDTREIIGDIGGDFQNATSSVVEKYLSQTPTIHVDQGTEITVIINRDLLIPIAS